MLRVRDLHIFTELASEVRSNKWIDKKKSLKFCIFIIRYRYRCTPSISDLEVVLDKVCVKHWEYKSSITISCTYFY
jgi:hypothetical protein